MRRGLLDRVTREFPAWQRLIAILVEGVFFLVLFPVGLARGGRWLDQALGMEALDLGWPGLVLGWMMVAAGFGLAMWSIIVQFTLGRGTPAPLMATQKLVTEPPYTYTRNPMTLGTAVMYLGLSVLTGSPSAVAIVLVALGLLLAYIKLIEEKEMALRFGEEYLVYRSRTPFLIPRLPREDKEDPEAESA